MKNYDTVRCKTSREKNKSRVDSNLHKVEISYMQKYTSVFSSRLASQLPRRFVRLAETSHSEE